MRSRRALLLATALSSLAAPAHAQVADRDVAVSAQSSDAETEIIVTAQKREQSLNDVGLTITALTASALQQRGISSNADLANAVPGLSYAPSTNNSTIFTLRGVGFNEPSLSAYPTVAVYLDEVSLPFPAMAGHSNYDLERVEVLKGPQGTLFGQNSTGGAVNFIAAKPTDTFKAGVDLSYGRFNTFTGEGYVSGPLANGVSARLAGRVEHGGDWQRSITRPNDTLGKTRNYMARLQLDIRPTETLRFLVNLNGWKDKSDTIAQQHIGYYREPIGGAGSNPFVVAQPFAPRDPRAADWTPGVPFGNNRMLQGSLRTELELTDSLTLTSITAYADYKQDQGVEGEGLPISVQDQTQSTGRIKTFSQEIRIDNGGSGPFRWVLGANYEHSKTQQAYLAYYPQARANAVYGSFGYPITVNLFNEATRLENYAIFASGEFDIADALTLKAGVRYTEAKRDSAICNSDPSGDPTNLGPFFYEFVGPLFFGSNPGPYRPGGCISFNDIGPNPSFLPSVFNGTLNEDNVSWRVGLDYKPSNDLLFYANVSRGYKAGSFPLLNASNQSQFLPARQESVTAYEAGVKATLIDGTLQANLTGFYYDYRDKQLRTKLADPTFSLLDRLENIPKSEIKGFEMELTARPTRGFVVGAVFTYLDSKIKTFTGINGAGIQANFAGSAIPYTPKYQAGVNADYDFPVTDRVSAFTGSSINFRSSTFASIGGERPTPGIVSIQPQAFKIDDYALVDLRAGIKAADDSWRFQVWGRNVFNTFYATNIVLPAETLMRYAGMPATYGATLSFRY